MYEANRLTAAFLPVMWDLTLLSNTLKEFVFCPSNYGAGPRQSDLLNVTIEEMRKVFFDAVQRNYPELMRYFIELPRDKTCTYGLKLKFGANISRISRHYGIFVEIVPKPICFVENNQLEYLDLTGAPFPSHFRGVKGLTKLKYLNVENTGIKSLPKNFLQYLPSLETLKLSKLDIRNFIESVDGHFFGSCPTLTEIDLDNCSLFSVLWNVQS